MKKMPPDYMKSDGIFLGSTSKCTLKTWGQGCCFRKEEHSYNKKNRVWKPSPCPFVSQERTVSSSQMTSFLNKHMTEKSTRFY